MGRAECEKQYMRDIKEPTTRSRASFTKLVHLKMVFPEDYSGCMRLGFVGGMVQHALAKGGTQKGYSQSWNDKAVCKCKLWVTKTFAFRTSAEVRAFKKSIRAMPIRHVKVSFPANRPAGLAGNVMGPR